MEGPGNLPQDDDLGDDNGAKLKPDQNGFQEGRMVAEVVAEFHVVSFKPYRRGCPEAFFRAGRALKP